MIAIYFWFPLFIFCAFSFVTQSLEIGFLAIFFYYLWQFYSPNSNLNKLKRKDSQEKRSVNNQSNSQIRHLQSEPRKFIQNITNMPFSQISLQKWFVVIIPIILFVFLTIFFSVGFYYNFVFSLFLNFIIVIFYYVFIGIVYLVSQLINKIYNSQNSQNSQKINQKVPIDYSSSGGIPNHTQQKNVEKNLIIDKIKSNLLSKWHFWATLVFGFLVNLIISSGIFQIILFIDFPLEILPIYLNLLIFGLFGALLLFGIQNRINSVLLGTILIISLFLSLGNIYSVNINFNFANFSTCKDFRIIKRNQALYHIDKNNISFFSDLNQANYNFEIKIENYKLREWKNQKIGEIDKTEKLKNCLIPSFENKKVILIEEIDKRDPNFPELPNTNFIPLPTDSSFSSSITESVNPLTNPPINLPIKPPIK